MKRFLVGVFIGLVIGWATVPAIKAAFVPVVPYQGVESDEDFRASHAYKWFLQQMLMHIDSIDKKMTDLNDNMKAVKEKLHA